MMFKETHLKPSHGKAEELMIGIWKFDYAVIKRMWCLVLDYVKKNDQKCNSILS